LLGEGTKKTDGQYGGDGEECDDDESHWISSFMLLRLERISKS
jgi:hypothetical protein